MNLILIFFLIAFLLIQLSAFFTIKFNLRTYIYHVYISVALIVFISIYVIDINTPSRWYHYFHTSAIVFSYFFNFVVFLSNTIIFLFSFLVYFFLLIIYLLLEIFIKVHKLFSDLYFYLPLLPIVVNSNFIVCWKGNPVWIRNSARYCKPGYWKVSCTTVCRFQMGRLLFRGESGDLPESYR